MTNALHRVEHAVSFRWHLLIMCLRLKRCYMQVVFIIWRDHRLQRCCSLIWSVHDGSLRMSGLQSNDVTWCLILNPELCYYFTPRTGTIIHVYPSILIRNVHCHTKGRRDRMVVGFTTTCTISVLSPLKLWVRIPLMVRYTRCYIMWSNLSVACDRSVVFSAFLH